MLSACRGCWPQPGPLQVWSTLAWLRARGGYQWARRTAASPAASRGDDASHRVGRPLAGRLPAAKGSHRLRRDSGNGNAVRVKEG
ncbi:hypothetical protein B296_00053053 [Ensete ventricosum]|uniref:Uncharacterized protein n=1 Tax=Ensete ventricosum TaxID=4639 RepID=A0A426WX78_ENSVE|nr:hypothetical protein B296_00053053 [Ensete ventricosum]